VPVFDITNNQNPRARGVLSFGVEGVDPQAFQLDSEGNITATSISTAGAFNVRYYGATGDGSTNDTAAVQAAAAAAVAAGGGVVFFPAGTYQINGSITVDNNIILAGVGNDSQIRQTSTTADLIIGTTVSWLTIRDLRLRGPGQLVGSGNAVYLDDNGNSSNANIVMENVLVDAFGGNGIEIETCIVSNFTGVNVKDIRGHGFAFTASLTGGTSISMNACYAHNCLNAGYLLYQMHYSGLQGCAADACGVGYFLDTCQAINLGGCGSEAMVVTDATYDGSAYRIKGGNTCALDNCYNYQNNAIAVKLTDGAGECRISGFRENTPLGGATASISIASGCLRNTVTASKVTTAMSLAGSVSYALPDSTTVPSTPSTGVEFHAVSGIPRAKSSNGTDYAMVPTGTTPADLGFAQWTYDPGLTSANTTTVAGTVYLARLYLKEPTSITKLWTIINTAGSGATAGQNWLGLYDSTGALVISGGADAIVASNGPVSVTVASTPLTVGAYWLAVVFNATGQPQLGRTSAAVASSNTPNTSASTLRYAINGTGRTTLATPITPASNTSGSAFWAGVS
jgi:hypothetical protein